MSEIKPCPFCGWALPRITLANGEAWVDCPDCGASGVMKGSRWNAINAWNRRHKEKTDGR